MKHKIIFNESEVKEVICKYLKNNNRYINIDDITLNVGMEYVGMQHNEHRVPVFKDITVEVEYTKEDWQRGNAADC